MKRNYLLLAIVLLTGLSLFGQAPAKIKSDPAYLDIDAVIDVNAAQPKVNINLPRFLLLNATQDLAAQNADVASIVQGIQHLRLVVFEPSNANRDKVLAGADKIRATLKQNWMPLVSVPDDGVGIYVMSDESGDEMAGLAALIANGSGEVVFINLVGNVPIAKVINLAQQMDNPEIQKALANIQGQIGGGTPPPAAESEKPETSNN
ncbi:MAG: DUF4252 domain-containing protein [Verrucomicrobiota bacterium JB022]|nr:DUF4252 domain-containing protein [Verrucomicrobiota bacterium JB022]